jgi:hypothetical protein
MTCSAWLSGGSAAGVVDRGLLRPGVLAAPARWFAFRQCLIAGFGVKPRATNREMRSKAAALQQANTAGAGGAKPSKCWPHSLMAR